MSVKTNSMETGPSPSASAGRAAGSRAARVPPISSAKDLATVRPRPEPRRRREESIL